MLPNKKHHPTTFVRINRYTQEENIGGAYEKKIGQDTPKDAGLRNMGCAVLDGRNAYLATGKHLPDSDR